MKIIKKIPKKIIIPAISCLALGLLLGTMITYSQDDLDKASFRNSEIVNELAYVDGSLNNEKTELTNLELKFNDLEKQKESIDAEVEAKAQAEAEAKAQAEAQAKAQAEAQAKAQAEAQAKAQAEAQAKAQAEAQAKAQAEAQAKAQAEAQAKAQAQAQTKAPNNTGGSNGSGGGGSSGTTATSPSSNTKVWKTQSGKRYHRTNNCGNTTSSNATLITLDDAQRLGLTPCGTCYK